MYGTVRPGYSPAPQARPSQILRRLTTLAAEQGRLVIDPHQAAAHILVANIGVTLRQIVLAQEHRALSVGVREGVIAAITGTTTGTHSMREQIHRVLEHAHAHPDVLGETETVLLSSWLRRLAASPSSESTTSTDHDTDGAAPR